MKQSPNTPPASPKNAAQNAGDAFSTLPVPAGGLGRAHDSSLVTGADGTITPSAPPPAGRPAKGVPTLRNGNDAQVADKLRQLIRDAESALRRILICGFFLHRLTEELPHGQLGKWIEAHCPDVSWRTVQRWKALALRVLDACEANATHVTHISRPLHEALALPMDDLPEDVRPIREKIDALIQGKSARQLWLDFKSCEEDSAGDWRPKVGRRLGEGGRPDWSHLPPGERLEIQQTLARRDWEELDLPLFRYGARFVYLGDHEIEAQLALLIPAVKARQEWLKHRAPHDRDVARVQAILRAVDPRATEPLPTIQF